jgi:FlgN protein
VDAVGALDEELWKHRERMTRLAFKARVAKLVLASDDRRSTDQAVGELAEALRDVRAHDHVVRRALRDAAAALGRPGADLNDLAGATQGADHRRLAEHAQAFRLLVNDLQGSDLENRNLAQSGLSNVRATMVALVGADPDRTAGYDRTGEGRPTARAGVDALL